MKMQNLRSHDDWPRVPLLKARTHLKRKKCPLWQPQRSTWEGPHRPFEIILWNYCSGPGSRVILNPYFPPFISIIARFLWVSDPWLNVPNSLITSSYAMPWKIAVVFYIYPTSLGTRAPFTFSENASGALLLRLRIAGPPEVFYVLPLYP